MLGIPRKSVLVLGAAAAVVALTAATALAAGDSDDSLSPANTSFTVSNSGNVKFAGTINGINVTVTCTSVTLGAKTRASGLTADVTSDPAFSGCTDTFGGTDTVTSSGTWTLKEVDAASDAHGTEPNTDQLTINVPQGGATFASTVLPGCTITANASSPTGSFNDTNTATFSGASISVTGSGCTATSTKLTGTFVTSINVGDLTS